MIQPYHLCAADVPLLLTLSLLERFLILWNIIFLLTVDSLLLLTSKFPFLRAPWNWQEHFLVLIRCLGLGRRIWHLQQQQVVSGHVQDRGGLRHKHQTNANKGPFTILTKLRQGLSNLLTHHRKEEKLSFLSTFWAEAVTQDSTRSTMRSGGKHVLWAPAPAGSPSPFKARNCCISMNERMCTWATEKTEGFFLFFPGGNKDSAVTKLKCQMKLEDFLSQVQTTKMTKAQIWCRPSQKQRGCTEISKENCLSAWTTHCELGISGDTLRIGGNCNWGKKKKSVWENVFHVHTAKTLQCC